MEAGLGSRSTALPATPPGSSRGGRHGHARPADGSISIVEYVAGFAFGLFIFQALFMKQDGRQLSENVAGPSSRIHLMNR